MTRLELYAFYVCYYVCAACTILNPAFGCHTPINRIVLLKKRWIKNAVFRVVFIVITVLNFISDKMIR